MQAVHHCYRLAGVQALCLAALLIVLPGCSVKWVAEYDRASVDQLLTAYGHVDRFYERLAETAPAERTYDVFQGEWSSISTELRTFALRQGARELNDESAEGADLLVKAWERERALHKQNSVDPIKRQDPYPNAKLSLDREQFRAAFFALVSTERFKE